MQQKGIVALRQDLLHRKVYSPRDPKRFVFLCGANKNKTTISARRAEILKFAQSHIPNSEFFLAEPIFEELARDGHKGNLLDIENEISKFADHIIIVLESNSAFCEFGAFSHEELRAKLIIVNDSKFKKSPSFINLGPVAAIEEIHSKSHVLLYSMSSNGIATTDGIGSIFSDLKDLLTPRTSKRHKYISADDCDPSLVFDKESIKFLHDLIFYIGPITYAEIIQLLLEIFGDKDFSSAKKQLALLVAFKTIRKISGKYYVSSHNDAFLRYQGIEPQFMARYRNWHLKNSPDRFDEPN